MKKIIEKNTRECCDCGSIFKNEHDDYPYCDACIDKTITTYEKVEAYKKLMDDKFPDRNKENDMIFVKDDLIFSVETRNCKNCGAIFVPQWDIHEICKKCWLDSLPIIKTVNCKNCGKLIEIRHKSQIYRTYCDNDDQCKKEYHIKHKNNNKKCVVCGEKIGLRNDEHDMCEKCYDDNLPIIKTINCKNCGKLIKIRHESQKYRLYCNNDDKCKIEYMSKHRGDVSKKDPSKPLFVNCKVCGEKLKLIFNIRTCNVCSEWKCLERLRKNDEPHFVTKKCVVCGERFNTNIEERDRCRIVILKKL